MRITKVDIPKSPGSSDGLEPIKMEKLGPIVIIAGKNGSGKTRILNKIISTLNSKPHKKFFEDAQTTLKNLEEELSSREANLSLLNSKLSKEYDHKVITTLNDNMHFVTTRIKKIKYQITGIKRTVDWELIETSELSENYPSVPFVPKNLNLTDSNSFTKSQMINHAKQIDAVGITHLSEGVYSKIQVIQDRWFNVTHQNSCALTEEKESAIKDYEKLKDLVQLFLNTSIERNIDGEATLFGFPMGKSNLSDGQKVLLQFCLAIYSQETALKDLILILDEPENHLHPSVIIEILNRIQKCNSNGQIWIATHSIPLLAHFDPSLIWFVENNKITHAGKIPEKVLYSLVGDENEIARLQDFISLPAQYATSRYAFESLIEPSTVMTCPDDPQSMQIREELLKISSTGKLRVLDYGAGKGRLISNLFDMEQTNQAKLLEKLEYIAYDKYEDDKEYCENSIQRMFGCCEKKYFNDFSSLQSMYDKESFNVIIMCNVLHEIDPKDWLKLFSVEGSISSLLSDNGVLLLVEDYQMPTGEKAYQKGFLVLDTQELKQLFKISENDTDFIVNDRNGNGRLKAHLIPKQCLIRIDGLSRLNALKSLSATAKEKILHIRNMEQNYRNGKLHGFWTQQFANAQLNIDELSTN